MVTMRSDYWRDMCGADSLCECSGCESSCDDVGSVGGFADTDVGQYAERVDIMVNTLDRDVQDADAGRAPGQIGQDFMGRWGVFLGEECIQALNEDGSVDEGMCVDWDTSDEERPIGWRQYRSHVGTGRLITLAGNKDAALHHIGVFERAYAAFRDEFVAAGGRTEAPKPDHPGLFQTLQEKQAADQSAPDWTTYAKAALVVLFIGAVGYAATGVSKLRIDT